MIGQVRGWLPFSRTSSIPLAGERPGGGPLAGPARTAANSAVRAAKSGRSCPAKASEASANLDDAGRGSMPSVSRSMPSTKRGRGAAGASPARRRALGSWGWLSVYATSAAPEVPADNVATGSCRERAPRHTTANRGQSSGAARHLCGRTDPLIARASSVSWGDLLIMGNNRFHALFGVRSLPAKGPGDGAWSAEEVSVSPIAIVITMASLAYSDRLASSLRECVRQRCRIRRP